VPPFVLHLAGNGEMVVPPPLEHVVKVHVGLSYPDFFALMSSMDVALLAFSESKKGGCTSRPLCLFLRNVSKSTFLPL
jgi:hypothetical protein